jgi:hypothetical protein
MKISHKEFARLLAAELGIDEKIANIHLLGWVSEINRVIESGETFTMEGFGSFSADDQNRPVFVPDNAFAAEINFAFEGMPEVDVEAAKSVVDEEMADFFDEEPDESPVRKTETLIVDQDVEDEDDPFGITEPDDVITPRILEMMAKKGVASSGYGLKQEQKPKQDPESAKEKSLPEDDFVLEEGSLKQHTVEIFETDDQTEGVHPGDANLTDAKAGAHDEVTEWSLPQDDPEDARQHKPADKDPFEFLNEMDGDGEDAAVPAITDQSDSHEDSESDRDFPVVTGSGTGDDFDPFFESDQKPDSEKESQNRNNPLITDYGLSETEEVEGSEAQDDFLSEIKSGTDNETVSDDPFFIPEESKTPAAISEIAELHHDDTTDESEKQEDVHKPTLSENFKVGNIAGKRNKKESNIGSDSKSRKKETSGNKQVSPVLWLLVAVAVVAVAFGGWWYLAPTTVQPIPSAGELPVAGLSQAMMDDIPTQSPSDEDLTETSEAEVAESGEIASVEPALSDEMTVSADAPVAESQESESQTAALQTDPPVVASQTTTGLAGQQPSGLSELQFGLRGDMIASNQRVFGIIIHSLATELDGISICNEIREQGLRCSVVQATTSDGRTTFRVALGQFESVAQAQQAISEIPRQFQRDGMWPARIN